LRDYSAFFAVHAFVFETHALIYPLILSSSYSRLRSSHLDYALSIKETEVWQQEKKSSA